MVPHGCLTYPYRTVRCLSRRTGPLGTNACFIGFTRVCRLWKAWFPWPRWVVNEPIHFYHLPYVALLWKGISRRRGDLDNRMVYKIFTLGTHNAWMCFLTRQAVNTRRSEIDIHDCYPLLKIDFAPIWACKNNRRIWRHNASILYSCDATDQL